MRLFGDSANIDDIREIARWGCLSGVTSNPSLIAEEHGDFTAILREVMEAYSNYAVETEVVAASVRHPVHMTQAALIGADIATIPPNVLRQMARHPLTDKGIQAFKDDWVKVQTASQGARVG